MEAEVAASADRQYDVFLSHRGPDVKQHFCSFLHEALQLAGIRTFKDETDLQPGDDAWLTMLAALRTARVVLPVFSKGYAQSPWCLNELVLMMKTPERVMPVFYDVEPGLQPLLTGIDRHAGSYQADKLEGWRAALSNVSDITGWRLDQTGGNVPQLVRNIVQRVIERLGRPARHVADHPVDLDARVAAIKQTLAQHSHTRAAVLGLYGMGGIGKTTLASAVYNSMHGDFIGRCCFLEVGQDADDRKLMQLQQKMLKELCGGISRDIHDVAEGTAELKLRLKASKVLLVIDDIWRSKQRDALLVRLGGGSCVLLTTRHKAVVRHRDMLEPHCVQLLSDMAALELFCRHAFGTLEALPERVDTAEKIVAACKGLPLTLRVVGAHLRQSDMDWDHALKHLKAARPFGGGTHDDDELWGRLKLSYNALGASERSMFLDIACCMRAKALQTYLAACEPPAGVAEPPASTVWQILVARSLASEVVHHSLYNKERPDVVIMAMHDQLRDMGRELARQHNGNPRQLTQRSRVFSAEAVTVLEQGSDATESLQGIKGPITLKAEAGAMANLRVLDLDTATGIGNFAGLYKGLRYLEWHAASSLISLPSTLVVLDLSYSQGLAQLPDSIGDLTQLQVLDVSGCTSLGRLPDAICELTQLWALDVSYCASMDELPHSIGELKGLRLLGLFQCQGLKALPDSICALDKLEDLNVTLCRRLATLPMSIGKLTGIHTLRLGYCEDLTMLPQSISVLTRLTELDLHMCAGLAELPCLGKPPRCNLCPCGGASV